MVNPYYAKPAPRKKVVTHVVAGLTLARSLQTDTVRAQLTVAFACSGTDREEVARSERFELPTLGFEVRCSIQLSYERINVFNSLE